MEQEKILGLILEKLESIDNRVGGLEAIWINWQVWGVRAY